MEPDSSEASETNETGETGGSQLGGTGGGDNRTSGHDRTSDDDHDSRTNDDDLISDDATVRVESNPIGGGVAARYRELHAPDPEEAERASSPIGSLVSIPDDSPSIQGSSISTPSRPGTRASTPSFRPFDRRFEARVSLPSRPSTPLRHSHSRRVSSFGASPAGASPMGTSVSAWDVVRWTRLGKLHGQLFSEAGRRSFGTPTCLAVASVIVVGTSKGVVLIFDLGQNLKTVAGPATKAAECGAVISVAISSDHTAVGAGHANGSVFTWEVGRASKPFLHIPPIDVPRPIDGPDGHVSGAAVTHLGFLGARRTALVSADCRGMAFAHLATRGTGSLGRTVKTTRILGRYPDAPPPKMPKPSTVLAFAPLPLGTERATDSMGLTAMLTPYLLVIVSTTPVAQTQHKAARPKAVGESLTGCLAWHPAQGTTPPKLAYCWSDVLTVLDVDEVPSEDADKPPTLKFRPRSRVRCDEPLVAVQWVGPSVLAALTATQRLLVVEDGPSLRVTDSLDLVGRHIFHADLYSEHLGEAAPDAFHMSFRTYRGRLFALGFGDVSIGAIAGWQDRLAALMERGGHVEAVELAASYHRGDAPDKLTVGLPRDASVVRARLVDVVERSLAAAFAKRAKNQMDDASLRRLVEAVFPACLGAGLSAFLFDDVFERYEDGGACGLFLETLEGHVLDGEVRSVPAAVVKALVGHYVDQGWEGRLEEMLCRMETATLDLDQVTQLCKKHHLYDALVYVWNQALGDYVTPLVDLLALVDDDHDGDAASALKMFPYLAYALTGRAYPTGEALPEDAAFAARCQLYWFLFCGKTVAWQGTTVQKLDEAFPYLRVILNFDAPSFLGALNEAFEDPFLDTDKPSATSPSEETTFGLSVDRQYVVSILLDVMRDWPRDDVIYLDMFVARNLAKFPQYLLLPSSTLDRVLAGLCGTPDDLAEDAQLSAEYLLSVYRPHDVATLEPAFRRAGFFRILKRLYRAEGWFGKLVEAFLDDPDDKDGVFACIAESAKHRQVLDIVKARARELLELDASRAAEALAQQPTAVHQHVLAATDAPSLQYSYLQALVPLRPDRPLIEHHIRLMCRFEPERVADHVNSLPADLGLDLVPAMEESGVVDGAVALMARDGRVGDAMDRIVRHLGVLEGAAMELVEAGQDPEDVLATLQKYVHVGIWLCQQTPRRGKSRRGWDSALSPEESLWLALIDAAVQTTRRLSAAIGAAENRQEKVDNGSHGTKTTALLRTLVQHTFTALLSAASQNNGGPTVDIVPLTPFSPLSPLSPSPESSPPSFLRILRAFLTRAAASSPTLADLRAVLQSIFSAYAYEESILRLSNRLLEQSLFVGVDSAATLRQRGWRPRASTCEGCGKRAWGPGVAGNIYEAWEAKTALDRRRTQQQQQQQPRGPDRAQWKGKAKSRSVDLRADLALAPADGPGALVLLACRHVYHYKCLVALQTDEEQEEDFRCPMHG